LQLKSYRRHINVVEQHLKEGNTYLMGATFMGVDIMLGHNLTWAKRFGMPVPESCMEYLQRSTARPAFKAAMLIEDPFHGGTEDAIESPAKSKI
jgi:glutathione S-transferase